MASTIQKLINKQNVIGRVIDSWKVQLTCAEEADLSFIVLCKYGELLRLYKNDIKKLCEEIGYECKEEIKFYRTVQFKVSYLKSIYEEYLISHKFSLDFSYATEMSKQLYLLNTVAALQPANCVSEEENEIFDHILGFFDDAFVQNEGNMEVFVIPLDKDQQTQTYLREKFNSIVDGHRLILENNMSIIRSLDSLCM